MSTAFACAGVMRPDRRCALRERHELLAADDRRLSGSAGGTGLSKKPLLTRRRRRPEKARVELETVFAPIETQPRAGDLEAALQELREKPGSGVARMEPRIVV